MAGYGGGPSGDGQRFDSYDNRGPMVPRNMHTHTPPSTDRMDFPLGPANGGQNMPLTVGRPSEERLKQPSSRRPSASRICGKCGEPLAGQFVRALDNTYHLDCFTCHVSLTTYTRK